MAVEVEITRAGGPGVAVAHPPGGPRSRRGEGVAARLVERLVADARAQGFKIVPSCSYVDAQRKRHPEWADLFAG